MKKTMRLMCMICVILLLGGCTSPSNNGYRYYKVDGQHYIAIDDVTVTDPDVEGAVIQPYKIKFQSFDEMLSDIRNGDFTEMERRKLEDNMEYYLENPLPIIDLDNLLQPTYPDNMYLDGISWTGPDMRILLRTDDEDSSKTVSVSCKDLVVDFSYYFSQVDPERVVNNLQGENYRVEVEQEADGNVTVIKRYYIESFLSSDVVVETLVSIQRLYSFTKDNATYYVNEVTNVEYDQFGATLLLVVNGDEFMYFSFAKYNGWSEAPSMEILSQFGFAPYKG